MTDERRSQETAEAPIDEAVLERTADRTGVDADEIAAELLVLNARLLGRHSELEHHDYVTIDSVRAYRVPDSEWDEFAQDVDVDSDDALFEAVKLAHTEQAQLMFADATGVDDRFEDEYGVVVGIDTAEEF